MARKTEVGHLHLPSQTLGRSGIVHHSRNKEPFCISKNNAYALAKSRMIRVPCAVSRNSPAGYSFLEHQNTRGKCAGSLPQQLSRSDTKDFESDTLSTSD